MKIFALCGLCTGAFVRDTTLLNSLSGEEECDGEGTSLPSPSGSFEACVKRLLEAEAPRKDLDEKTIFEGCSDAGMLIGGLVKGVKDAGYMQDYAIEGGKLTFTVTQDQLYGELATSSKVPVMWGLAKTTTFEVNGESTFATTTVDITGLQILPPQQGLAIYEEAVPEDVRCAPAEMKEITEMMEKGENVKKVHPCLAREMKAAGEGLHGFYMKNYIKKDGPHGVEKIDAIMKKIKGSWATWMAVHAELPKIFYSMMISSPASVEALTFSKLEDPKKYISASSGLPAGVMATTVPDRTWRGEAEHGLIMKSQAMAAKSIADALKIKISLGFVSKGGIDFAEGAARSGMAFAEMLAWGSQKDALKDIWTDKPHMGSADALTNMVSFCDKDATQGRTGTDDPICTGKDIGRVSWAPHPSARMSRETPA